MKTKTFAAAIFALAVVASAGGAAWSAEARGEVRKIDAAASKITLKHGPIKSLDMDEGMTMVFVVKDAAMLKVVKVGDKVGFDASRINGQYVVTAIEKSK